MAINIHPEMAGFKCVERVRKIGPTFYVAVRKTVARNLGLKKGDLLEFSVLGKISKGKETEDWNKWTY
jgi:hypothetical protein